MKKNRQMNDDESESAMNRRAPGSRRQFIKSFVVGTAFSTNLGKEWCATVLAACQPATQTGGILRVKLSDFPALQGANGSVRLALNPFSEVGPSGSFYPVLVNRGTNNQFFALNTRCTHQFCVVPPFDVGSGASVCPCHGSRFRIDGTVIPGSPAFSSLQRFTVNLDGTDLLCIEIPNLRYALTTTTVQSGVGPRVRLQFQTRSNLSYEVLFRQSFSEAGTVVPFSTTESDVASESVLTGNNQMATIYVDRTSEAGFFTVAVQVTEA